MRQRIRPAVLAWFNGQANGLHDNSIAGAADLNNLPATLADPLPYVFTMAFRATNPFPNRTLTRQDVEGFIRLLPAGNIFNLLSRLRSYYPSAARKPGGHRSHAAKDLLMDDRRC